MGYRTPDLCRSSHLSSTWRGAKRTRSLCERFGLKFLPLRHPVSPATSLYQRHSPGRVSKREGIALARSRVISRQVLGLSRGYAMKASGHGPVRGNAPARALRHPAGVFDRRYCFPNRVDGHGRASAADGGSSGRLRSDLHRRARAAAPGRPADGRGGTADRPAGGDGPAHRRPAARAVAVRPDLARRRSTRCFRIRRAEEHDRCHLAARHPDAAAADRHGDRSATGAARRPRGGDRRHRRRDGAVHLRFYARRNAAGRISCRSRMPASSPRSSLARRCRSPR